MSAALPQYEFVELIGAGGMGAVYKARQPKLDRFVAIKILPPIPDDELGFADRFEREAQSMARLSHPHIVSVFDFGETADWQLYFVMEYVEGADLHQLITGGQLTLDHFYGWIPQVCEAIQYAHDRGIIHRDIKPANILIDTEGRVKIADFGLAKLTGDHPDTALTKADLSMGTPDYAAPEQLDGSHEVDWRSDIYSLGVVMYQMLTGRLPRGAFPLPSETDGSLDSRLDSVVIQAMQASPESRFQRASDISDRLTSIRTETPVPEPPSTDLPSQPRPTPTSRASRKRSSLFPVVGGLVGLSVVIGVALAVITHDKRKERRESLAGALAPKEPSRGPEAPTSPPSPATGAPDPKPAKPTPPLPAAGETPDSRSNPPGEKAIPGRGTTAPPRDFSRRNTAAPDEGERPGNFASFRDKLGRKASEFGRRNQANLTIVSRTNDGFDQAGPLVEIPKDMIPLAHFTIGQSPPQVDAGHKFALGVQVEGSVIAWGDNSRGQLDFPPEAAVATAVAAGSQHGLALRPDGRVVAWGANDEGQCAVPAGLAGVTAIAAGRDFSLALTSEGEVVAWGGSTITTLPDDLGKVTAIAAGYSHAAALREDGTVATWGTNEFHQLIMPPDLDDVVAITCNFGNTYALRADGSAVSWGAAGKESALPKAAIVDIRGTGDSLIARDRGEQLIVLGHNGRPAPVPGFLRQVPMEVRLEFAGPLIFAWRPAKLHLDESGAPAPTPDSLSQGPVVPEDSQTEAGLAIAEKLRIFEEAYPRTVTEPWEESIAQLNQFYLNHLEERQAEAAAATQLEEAVAWRDEAERIRSGEPIPESDDPALTEGLRELRQTYREKAQEHEEARRLAEETLLGQFENALQQLQDRFTAEQKLDDALEVKAFIDRRKTE